MLSAPWFVGVCNSPRRSGKAARKTVGALSLDGLWGLTPLKKTKKNPTKTKFLTGKHWILIVDGGPCQVW